MQRWPLIVIGASALALGAWQPRSALPYGLDRFEKWEKVNAKPHPVTSYVDGLCRSATPAETKDIQSNPHVHRAVTVYVNAIGRTAMRTGGPFPVGSVIVKNKVADPNVPESLRPSGPDISTIMIKREKGYNPSCGDWEFAVMNAAGTQMTARGKLENCITCHAGQSQRDFVFRSYVSSAPRVPSTSPSKPLGG